MEQGINVEGYTQVVADEIFTQTKYIITDPRQPPGTEVLMISKATIPSKKKVLETIVGNAKQIINFHTPVLPRKEPMWDDEKGKFVPVVVYMEHENPVQGMLLETPYSVVQAISRRLMDAAVEKNCPAKDPTKAAGNSSVVKDEEDSVVIIEYGILPQAIADKCAKEENPEIAYKSVMANSQLRQRGLGHIVSMSIKLENKTLPDMNANLAKIREAKAPDFIKEALEKAITAVYQGNLEDIEDYSEGYLIGVSMQTLINLRIELQKKQQEQRLAELDRLKKEAKQNLTE